jgi:hypothetical protein
MGVREVKPLFESGEEMLSMRKGHYLPYCTNRAHFLL